jgi:hypothetical protein
MRRVILESPYRGGLFRRWLNVRFARACARDCLMRGEAVFASHLLYTQPGVLRDDIEDERKLGIDAGHAWIASADAMVVYIPSRGVVSPGMNVGIARARAVGIPVEFRRFDPTGGT